MTTQFTLAPSATDGGVTLLRWLREMRDNQPVWRDAYGVWQVFRYADVHRAISEPDVFSSDIGRVVPAAQKLSEGNLVRTDPPRHHQLPPARRCGVQPEGGHRACPAHRGDRR